MTVDEINIHEPEPQYRSRMPAHRALIPEVLDVVLSFSDQSDCARCIRVCKDWADTAISHTWMDVHDPMVFLQMVAPLMSDNRQYEEDSRIVEADVLTYGQFTLPRAVKVRIYSLSICCPSA